MVPSTWAGGAAYNGTLSTIVCTASSAYGVRQDAGTYFRKVDFRTQTYSNSVSTGYVGLNISSAYTNTSGLTVKYVWNQNGAACGNNNKPVYAQYVYVG